MVSVIGIIYFIVFFILAVVGVIIGFAVYMRSYNYRVIVKRVTSDNTKIVRIVKGKIKRDKQKIPYLSLWFGLFKKPMPNKIPVPPAEVVEYDNKAGRLQIECLYDDERGYTFIRDSSNLKPITDKVIEGFEPFPTKHREMMVNQLYKRDARKPKTAGEILVYMTPFIALIMILTIFMIFYGKALEPTTELAKDTTAKVGELLEKQTELTNTLDTMMRNAIHYQRGENLEGNIITPES